MNSNILTVNMAVSSSKFALDVDELIDVQTSFKIGETHFSVKREEPKPKESPIQRIIDNVPNDTSLSIVDITKLRNALLLMMPLLYCIAKIQIYFIVLNANQ